MVFKNYKILVLIFVLCSSLSADYLYEEGSICVTDYSDTFLGCKITLSSDGSKQTESDNCDNLTFIDGYSYDNSHDTCNKLPITPDELNLSENDFYFLMGLSGMLFGFVWLFFIAMLSTLATRK